MKATATEMKNRFGTYLNEVNLGTKLPTLIASGGSRGDFVTVDTTNDTLLLTQSDRILRILRLAPPPGGGFVGGGGVVPESSDLALLGLGLPALAGLLLRARRRAPGV